MNSTNKNWANLLRTAIFKRYLKFHRWFHPRMFAKFCEPLFEGLHPSNVFHYRSEFFIENVCPSDIVIDIACGTGRMMHELSPYIKKGYGIEIDRKNMDLCKSKHGNANIEYIEGDIFKLDYEEFKKNTGCNIAVLSHILEHIENVPSFLKELNAETLLICVPSQQNWFSQLLIHLELPYFTCNTHFREYTREMLQTELTTAAYRIDFMGFNSEGEIICKATKGIS